jgi:hypothetical protein
MAIGDAAAAAGMPLVPGTGEEGKRKYGAREINRTRDFVAQAIQMIPVGVDAYRSNVKINAGPGVPGPNDGTEGEIWFQII